MIQNSQYKNKSNLNECFYFSQNSNIECINSTIKCIGFELFHYVINLNDFLSFVVFTNSPKKTQKMKEKETFFLIIDFERFKKKKRK